MTRTPVIDITDLYHPHQDADDNLDLLVAYGLPEIDLLGVILDAHQAYRQPVATGVGPGLWEDPDGPREPGFIPVLQLDYLFNRATPCAVGPFTPMRSPDDAMLDAPAFQQQGVKLLLRLLRDSPRPVQVIVQGSSRPLAVALNREPDLLAAKIERVHLCAGATTTQFLEWNVALDPHATVRLLRSKLPVVLYPPATGEGPFAMDAHNVYWRLETRAWMQDMEPRLRRYLDFVYGRAQRMDFLRALDEDGPAQANAEIYAAGQHLWTTAMWMEITGRRLARNLDGAYRLAAPRDRTPGGAVLAHALRPCELEVRDDGRYSYNLGGQPTARWIYERDDLPGQARALNQAFPALLLDFNPDEDRRG